jgi:hypothetical protein
MPRSLVGKIARLPHTIRSRLNRRLLNGHPGPDILSWLNELPIVKQILAAQFQGAPITHKNLCNWRQTGYPRWLKETQACLNLRKQSRFAARMARAGHGIVRGAAAVASSQIMELLTSQSDKPLSPDDFRKLTAAMRPLLQAEDNKTRFKIAEERVLLGRCHFRLGRDKHQRDCVAIGLRLLGNQRAKEIEAADIGNAEKIEILGIHLFGDLWHSRPIPTPENPNPRNVPYGPI